jgi:hypothetical protein
MHITRGVKRSANLKGVAAPAFAGNSNEDQWVTNFQESFQQTLDQAPARKAAAEARLKTAEAELAATPATETATLTAIQKRITAEKSTIAMQEGALRDMPLGAARGEGQEGDLRARAQGAEPEGRGGARRELVRRRGPAWVLRGGRVHQAPPLELAGVLLARGSVPRRRRHAAKLPQLAPRQA